MTAASMTLPGEVGRGTSLVRRTAIQRMRLAKPLAASELVEPEPQLVGRDVAEEAEVVAMDLRLVLRARVPQGHVVPGVAQHRRERRAVARHAREESRELGLERQGARLLGVAHEVAGDALARGHARDQQVADRVGPPEDVGSDAVGGALAAAEGRGPDEHGVELGRLHRALVQPARVTAGDPEHRQQRGQDADGVGLGMGLDRVGDLAEDAVERRWRRWGRPAGRRAVALAPASPRRGGCRPARPGLPRPPTSRRRAPGWRRRRRGCSRGVARTRGPRS